jgi:quercetin dioxygenase-like cupin family protein
MAVLISSIENPVQIKGMHGGSGTLFWKCFARLHMLHTDLVAFEYARLESGGIIGDHTHTRTEEIYFIVSGHGTMHVDGETRKVGPGDLILTPRNTTHGITTVGSESLEFVVAEVFPPEVQAAMPQYKPEA